jgi:uncharacterized protein YodC (DUF2158 family)
MMTTDKYWIKKGMKVRHDSIDSDVVVDRIVYKDVKQKDGSMKKFTQGVKCHWINDEGEFRTGVFHTSELHPIA